MLHPDYKNKAVQKQMLSTEEYAAMRGITRQAVVQAIKNGWQMPGVEKVETVGGRSVIFMKPVTENY